MRSNAVAGVLAQPCFMTFSDSIPRVPEDVTSACSIAVSRTLLYPRYVRLLALSEYSARQFRHQNRDFGPAALEEKLEVRYPAVLAGAHGAEGAPRRYPAAAFVGRDFMRKGGPALVLAHSSLPAWRPGATTIISLAATGRRTTPTSDPPIPPARRARARTHIAQEGIVHHRGAPNAEVSPDGRVGLLHFRRCLPSAT